MGFGWLLYGFLMLLEVSIPINYVYMIGLDVFPDLAGYLLMLTAAYRLADYAPGFAHFKKALIPLVGLSALEYGLTLFSLAGVGLSALSVALSVLDNVCLVLQAIAILFLFSGMAVLAESVELPTIAKRARLFMVIGMTYYVFQLLLNLVRALSLSLPTAVLTPVQGIVTILYLVFIIFGEVVIFNCYMYICYEGEENVDATALKTPIESLVERIKRRKDD